MFSHTSNYFSEQFKEIVKAHIAEERPIYQREFKSAYQGRRFRDNEQVWQAFVQQLPNQQIMHNEAAGQVWAQEMEKGFLEMRTNDWRGFKARIWDALSNASDCDYYYDHEKQW